MHELSLAYSVVKLIDRELSHCGGGELRQIEMAIGNLSGVDREAFEFALEAVLAHTPFAKAELKVNEVEARAECSQCSESFFPETRYSACPHCGGFAWRLIVGEEFRLTALAVES